MAHGGSEGTFTKGCNGQVAIDADHQIIVGVDLPNVVPDAEQLIPMLDQVRQNLDGPPSSRMTGWRRSMICSQAVPIVTSDQPSPQPCPTTSDPAIRGHSPMGC